MGIFTVLFTYLDLLGLNASATARAMSRFGLVIALIA